MKNNIVEQIEPKMILYGFFRIFASVFVILLVGHSLNFQDLSIKENFWQYSVIIIALFNGVLAFILNKPQNSSLRKKIIFCFMILAAIIIIPLMVYFKINNDNTYLSISFFSLLSILFSNQMEKNRSKKNFFR